MDEIRIAPIRQAVTKYAGLLLNDPVRLPDQEPVVGTLPEEEVSAASRSFTFGRYEGSHL